MSDQTVRDALRSDLRLVVIEAPAGCGKTHQGAEYAREIAQATDERVLILRSVIVTPKAAGIETECAIVFQTWGGPRRSGDPRQVHSFLTQNVRISKDNVRLN